MYSDPILREVHRMKDQFAREVGYDLGKRFERLREDAKKHPERIAQPTPKPVTPRKRPTANKARAGQVNC